MADTIWYVNPDVIGGLNDGTSPANAYLSVLDGLIARAQGIAGGDQVIFNCLGASPDIISVVIDLEALGWTGDGNLVFQSDVTVPWVLDNGKYIFEVGNFDKPFYVSNAPNLILQNFQYHVPRGGATYPFYVRNTVSGPGAPNILIDQSYVKTHPDFSSNKDVYRIDGTLAATDLEFIIQDSTISGIQHSILYANYIDGTDGQLIRSNVQSGRFIFFGSSNSTYHMIDSTIDKTGEDAYARGSGTIEYCATNDGEGTFPQIVSNWDIDFEDRANDNYTLTQSASIFADGSTGNNIGADQVTTSTDPSNFISVNGGATISQTAKDVALVFADFAGTINAVTINDIDHSDLLENVTATTATIRYIRRLTDVVGTESFSVVIGDGTIQKGLNNDFTTSYPYDITYGFVDDNGAFAGVTVTNTDAYFREISGPITGFVDYTKNVEDDINEIYTPAFGTEGVDSITLEVHDPGTNVTLQGVITLTVSGDSVAPSFLVPIAVNTVTNTTYNVTFTADEGGTQRVVILPNGASAPSASEVAAGTGAGGAAPAFASSIDAMSASTAVSVPVSGLTEGNRYDTYVVLIDPSANDRLGSLLDTLMSGTAPVEVAPVFIGNIADQSIANGSTFNLDVSGQWSNTPTFYTVTTGSLPSGLTLANTGIISGTVDTVESLAGIIITGTNTDGSDVSNAFSFEVTATALAPVFIGNIPNQIDTEQVVISVDISGNWSNSPTAYNVTMGSLPTGVTLSNAGVISGTLTAVQSLADIIITASNATGDAVSNSFTWTVQAATSTKLASLTGITNADGSLYTGVISNWYITASDIEASNKAGVAIVPVASGEDMQVTNGTASVAAPGASLSTSYAFTGSIEGAVTNGQSTWFRDVTVTISEV